MAASKVVRVEDVEENLSQLSSTALLASSSIPLAHTVDHNTSRRKSSSEFTGLESYGSQKTDSTGLDEEDEAEAAEKVYPLPENWPKIKQLQRPMSCALSTSRMPCVRKAVSHLELIQNIIDEWFKHVVEHMKSQSSARPTSTDSVQVAPRKQLRFQDPSTRSTTAATEVSSISKSSRNTSATLSVTGTGVESAASPVNNESVDQGLQIPYLGAEDVIEEVITLLARLENDRLTTQQRFEHELETAIALSKKINGLCLRRLKELPELVQREHEACILDLNELQWHLAYTARTQVKSQQRKGNAELLHNHLREDIEFVKMHVPLVEEKLVLELQAMDRIKKAQVETNQELMTTKQRQAKTEQKSTEALSKAETERGHIRRELDNVRDNLTQISEELSMAKMTFNSYVHQMNDTVRQLSENNQELEVLLVKDKNARTTEEMQATKVRSLQSRITDAEFEYRRMENENIQAEEALKIMESRNLSRLDELQQKAKVLEGKVRVILRHNSELSIIIGDLQEEISECEKQKTADEKNIRRIQRETERVETMMLATAEEHSSVSAINRHIRDQLHMEQEKAFRSEEALKYAAESLRRQVKEEVHTRTVLQARITADNSEIEKSRLESGKKKEKADKVASDVQLAVTTVLDKVEKLRSVKVLREEQKISLISRTDDIKKQYEDSLKNFKDRLSIITPHYNKLKDELAELEQQRSKLHDMLEASMVETTALGQAHGIVQPEMKEMVEEKEEKEKLTIVHISSSEGDRLPKKPKFPGLRLRNVITDKDLKPKPSRGKSYIRLLQIDVENLDQILEHMELKSDLMNKKIEEMDSAQSMMVKVFTRTELALESLVEELEELTKQVKAMRKIGETLKFHVIAVNDRLRDGEIRHSRLLQDRCAVLLKQEDDKISGLKKNKDMAARYRQLQYEFLVKKEQLLRTFDDRLKMEATINDVKQLKSLQSKMHGALTVYFKLSGLYNEGELMRLEQVSAENGLRVGQLQKDMEEALELITSFLKNEMDGTRSRQMAREAAQKMEEQKRESLMAGTNGAGARPVLAS